MMRAKRMGWLSVYSIERGEALRFRWRVCGADGAVLAHSNESFATERAAYASVERVSGLLVSILAIRSTRAA